MFIWTGIKWIWEAIPQKAKTPLILILAPIALIMSPIAITLLILWYTLFLPWQTHEIKATVVTENQHRDMKYESLVERQTLINTQTKESLERIDRHQVVMMEYILRNSK